MTIGEQLFPVPAPLTPNQQRAWDHVRTHNGVTADEIGALNHAHRDRNRHPADQRCDWCGTAGRNVLTSKALKPLVRYRIDKERGRLYIVRNPADQVHPPKPPRREPTEAELAANPFAGLEQ